LRYLRDWRDWRDWQDWQDWRYLLLTSSTTEKALQLLPTADEREAIDLCAILLGRLLYIEETKEKSRAIGEEIQRVAEAARRALATVSGGQKELREALLDVLRNLPARSSEEIIFVQQLAEKTTDQNIRQALVRALSRARPDHEALPTLQAATTSPDVDIAQAAQYALEQEQKRRERPVD
jgi:hypothetical protein